MYPTTIHRPVVVGVDGSPASMAALDWAVEEAQRRHLPLRLCQALWMPPRAGITAEADWRNELTPELALALGRVRSLSPDADVTTVTAHGSAAPVLLDASRDASMLVVGARRRSAVTRATLGSTSFDVAAHGHCPVAVVRELPSALPDRPGVVVGVDGSAVSEAAVAQAFLEADTRGLPLTVVHAWALEYDPTSLSMTEGAHARRQAVEEERALVAEAVAGWAEKYPDVVLHHHVLNQHPVKALVDHSRGAELLVVGSRGRSGLTSLLLGSVSHAVLRDAHCPVLVVRPVTETSP